MHKPLGEIKTNFLFTNLFGTNMCRNIINVNAIRQVKMRIRQATWDQTFLHVNTRSISI